MIEQLDHLVAKAREAGMTELTEKLVLARLKAISELEAFSVDSDE